ncbi:ATP-binding protein [Deinococcus hohokamensis]|uniref:histidine kinase n=1 Tax=Deinococcus hohokamensis TaxID=309883 RepID=A0ABV9I9K2_9DEIO
MPEDQFLTPELMGGPAVDLSNCAREPIHIPGSIQPHGVVIVLSLPDLRVVQASANTGEHLGLLTERLLGQTLSPHLTRESLLSLRKMTTLGDRPQTFPVTLLRGTTYDATVHVSQDVLVLELEAPISPEVAADIYRSTQQALQALEAASDVLSLCAAAATQVRALTGFDRVMIYRFAEDDSGEVIAEAKLEDLHAYLGHRFPESDIPQQARALYLKNMLRLTADVSATVCPLVPPVNPVTRAPLDMSQMVLRSTSPMHVQYLKNMGVASSLSVSIVQDGRLWGLISCHHNTARFIPQQVRASCEFLGRVLAMQLTAKRDAETFRFRESLKQRHQQILHALTASPLPMEAVRHPELDLVGFMRAGGAAVHLAGQTATLGQTPSASELGQLLSWLRAQDHPSFHTASLGTLLPGALAYASQASGVLGVSVSGNWEEYLLWFRPEIPQTITWGGNPDKPVQFTGDGQTRLTPRASFDDYVQQVKHTALPWHPGELAEAESLRDALVATTSARLAALQGLHDQLQRAHDALARSNAELQHRNDELAQFAYVASHDLQEPLRILGAYSDILRHRYEGQLDSRAQTYLRHIGEQVFRARQLVRDVLTLSNVTEQPPLADVDLQKLWQDISPTLPWPAGAQVDCGELPHVYANVAQVQQLLTNLFGNAIKFRAERPLHITFTGEQRGRWVHLAVRDNGVGIAPEHAEQVFVMFQRLQNRTEQLSGNGIGLAVCKKVVERHGGHIWIEGKVGEGTTVHFTLPAVPEGGAAVH